MNNEQLRCGYTTELQAIGHPLSNLWEFRKKLKSADTSLHRSQLLTVNNPSVTCGDGEGRLRLVTQRLFGCPSLP